MAELAIDSQASNAATEQTPRENAEAYLRELSSRETGNETTPEPSDGKQSEAEVKPEPEPKADELAELRAERRRASDLLTKAKGQHEALTRRESKIVEREKESESRAKEIEAASDSPTALVEYIARTKGIDVTEIWNDIAEQLRNGGKRTPEAESNRKLAALERKIEEDRKAREDEKAERERLRAEQEAIDSETRTANALAQTRESAVALIQKDPEQYPTLNQYPKKTIGPMVLDVINEYCESVRRQSGSYPSELPPLVDFIDYLEKREAEEQKPSTTEAKKPKPKLPTNTDASSEPDVRALSHEERKALAARELAEGKL